MTWIAPDVDRSQEPPLLGDERIMLEGWLDWHRNTLLHKCAGLTGEQLVLRSAEPSSLSLLGLVRHMSKVERVWFRELSGDDVERLYSTPDHKDADFDNTDATNAEADFDRYREELELARKTAEGRSLDITFYYPKWDETLNLRWIYVHMIEEYARHNGHADLLRERIDGATGS